MLESDKHVVKKTKRCVFFLGSEVYFSSINQLIAIIKANRTMVETYKDSGSRMWNASQSILDRSLYFLIFNLSFIFFFH